MDNKLCWDCMNNYNSVVQLPCASTCILNCIIPPFPSMSQMRGLDQGIYNFFSLIMNNKYKNFVKSQGASQRELHLNKNSYIVLACVVLYAYFVTICKHKQLWCNTSNCSVAIVVRRILCLLRMNEKYVCVIVLLIIIIEGEYFYTTCYLPWFQKNTGCVHIFSST